MPTWGELTSNQLVDYDALQSAVDTGLFNVNPGESIPAGLQCITSAEAALWVDARTDILPADPDQLPMKSELVQIVVYDPTEVGIMVLDHLTLGTSNMIGYFDTPTVSIPNGVVHRGNYISPDMGTVPAAAYIITGDVMNYAGQPGFRFEFNIARILTEYPSVNPIIFKVAGRAVTATTITATYSLKTANDSIMKLDGSPGSYVPGVLNDHSLGGSSYSISIGAGADGSYDIADLPVLTTFIYDRTTQTFTHV